MSFSINKIYLAGNTTNDPELKYTPNGNPVLNFSMATNRGSKGKDGVYKNIPTFHRIIVWGKIAEYLARNLKKGDQVVVEGRQDNRSYEDKDGNKKYISEVIADSCIPPRRQKAESQPTDLSEPAKDADEAAEILTQKPPTDEQLKVVKEKVNPDDIPF